MPRWLRVPLIGVFCRLHTLCTQLLPREFRERHGVALFHTFRDALTEAADSGTFRLLATATGECADVARQGLAARRSTARRGILPARSLASLLDGVTLDLRVALRSLPHRHSLFVVAALALGLGATTAMFGVLDTVLLRDLPYPDAERLVRIGSLRPRSTSLGALSPPLLRALYDRPESLEETAASATSWVTLTGDGRPERLRSAWVSGAFFTLLGAEANAGRLLTDADDRASAPSVAVLSYDFWQRRFGADDAILTQSVTLSGRTYSVIGILAPDFVPPEGNRLRGAFDVWLPLAHFELMREPDLVFLDAFARLGEGTPLSQAAGEVDALGRALAAELGLHERVFSTLQLAPLRRQTIGAIGPKLWTLMGAVLLLLTIACTNVANLMLARAVERRHEVGLRFALGAGATRVARLLLFESTLLALIGGGVGVALARVAVTALRAFEPVDIPRLNEVGIDLRVLAFALIVTLVVGGVTSLMAMLRVRRVAPARSLRNDGRPATAGSGRDLLSRALVAAQTALALMLVIAAGLLMHSFVRLARVDVGFDVSRLMRLQVSLDDSLNGSDEAQRARTVFFDRLRQRVREIPGVRAAHLTTGAPFSPGGWYSSVTVVGRAEGEIGGPGAEESAFRHQVSGGHLGALGLRILQGREITGQDGAGAPPVVVINQSLARHYWPEGDALGARIIIGGDGTFTPRTIVGIVSDARYHELEDDDALHIYLPFEQFPAFAMDVLARFQGEPPAIAAAMREAVWSLRSDLAIRDVSTMRDLVYADLVEPGFYTWLLGSFASVALLLAGIGIYGSMAHVTARRTREIGIRIAIGAQPAEAVRMVVGGALSTTAVGMTAGLAGAWASTRYLSGFLYEIEATDALAYAAASVCLLLLALLAAWLPARRAARVDPVVALRAD